MNLKNSHSLGCCQGSPEKQDHKDVCVCWDNVVHACPHTHTHTYTEIDCRNLERPKSAGKSSGLGAQES